MSQDLSQRMMETPQLARLRFQLVATEFLVRMGARIRERRIAMGLSRGELARTMPGKVSENQVYRWEKGQHQPQPDTLEALALALDCDVAYFMTPEPKETRTPDAPGSPSGSSTKQILKLLTHLNERVDAIYALLAKDEVTSDTAEAEAELAALPDRIAEADAPQKPQGRERPARGKAAGRRKSA